jgi:type I site-specific restriction endonuclease
MLSRWCRLPVSARGHRSIHKIAKTLAPPEPLKSWQEDAIQACMTAIHAGRTRIGIQMAQGSQSTLAGLMDQIQQNSNLDAQRRQILVVTESTARGKKIAEKVSKRCPHLKVEIEIKKEKNLMLSHADVCVFPALWMPNLLNLTLQLYDHVQNCE